MLLLFDANGWLSPHLTTTHTHMLTKPLADVHTLAHSPLGLQCITACSSCKTEQTIMSFHSLLPPLIILTVHSVFSGLPLHASGAQIGTEINLAAAREGQGQTAALIKRKRQRMRKRKSEWGVQLLPAHMRHRRQNRSALSLEN